MDNKVVEKRVKYITTKVNNTLTDDINEYYPFFRTLARITSNYYFPVNTIKTYKNIYKYKQHEEDLITTLNTNLHTCKIDHIYKREFIRRQNNIIRIEQQLIEESNSITTLYIKDLLKRAEYKLLHIPIKEKEREVEQNVNYDITKGLCYIKR